MGLREASRTDRRPHMGTLERGPLHRVLRAPAWTGTALVAVVLGAGGAVAQRRAVGRCSAEPRAPTHLVAVRLGRAPGRDRSDLVCLDSAGELDDLEGGARRGKEAVGGSCFERA